MKLYLSLRQSSRLKIATVSLLIADECPEIDAADEQFTHYITPQIGCNRASINFYKPLLLEVSEGVHQAFSDDDLVLTGP
jgi:hypothetical protein